MSYFSTVYWEWTPRAEVEMRDYMRKVPIPPDDEYSLQDIVCNADRVVLDDGTISYYLPDVRWSPGKYDALGVVLFKAFLSTLDEAMPEHYSFIRIGEDDKDIEILGQGDCHAKLVKQIVRPSSVSTNEPQPAAQDIMEIW